MEIINGLNPVNLPQILQLLEAAGRIAVESPGQVAIGLIGAVGMTAPLVRTINRTQRGNLPPKEKTKIIGLRGDR